MSAVFLVLVLNFLYNFALYSSVWNVLLESLGFGLGELSLYVGLLFLSQLLWEIPSGIISERFGARRTLLAGQAVGLIGLLIFTAYPNLVTLLLTAVASGFANALYSDTDTQFVYSYLCAHGKSPLFSRYIAINNSLGFVGEAVASFAGALIAHRFGLVATLWWTLPVIVAHLLVTCFLPSEQIKRRCRRQQYFDPHSLFVSLKRSKNLREIMALSTFIYTLNLITWYYYQSFGEEGNISLTTFGWWAVWMALAEALPQYAARYYVCHPQIQRVFAICIILSCLCLAAASFKADQPGFLFLLLTVGITGFTFPISESLLRRESKPRDWSNLAAAKTFANVLVFVLGNLFFGFLAEHVGILPAFAYFGLVSFVAMVIFLLANDVWRRQQVRR